MSATKHHADVLVLGSSVAGALAATLLARRGSRVLWAGAPAPSFATAGEHRVRTAPAIFPALAQAPGLTRVLDEVGLLADVQRQLEPVRLQFLDERLRATVPGEAAAAGTALAPELGDQAEALRLLSAAPASDGFLARRAATRRSAALSTPELPTGPAGEVIAALDLLLGGAGLRVGVRIGVSPHLLPGGSALLVELLHRRFVELGGRTLPHALSGPMERIAVGWSGASCVCATGVEAGGRVLVCALDDGMRARLWPAQPGAADRLRLRLGSDDPAPLHRTSFVLRRRGLPVPLGPLALVRGAAPLMLERRPITPEVDELAAWTRPARDTIVGEAERVTARLGRVLPFFERHVLSRSTGEAADDATALPSRPIAPARRLLQAIGADAHVPGVEGAAVLAEAVARRAWRLAPRKDALK